jgi:hypothetical protein
MRYSGFLWTLLDFCERPNLNSWRREGPPPPYLLTSATVRYRIDFAMIAPNLLSVWVRLFPVQFGPFVWVGVGVENGEDG